MGAMVAIAKARITERIHRHHLRVGRVAARLQARHRGDNLEGAGRWEALEGAIQQGRIGGIEAAPLAGTRRRRKNIGVKGGPAGQGPNCSGLGVERHDRPLAHPVEGALCSLLQRQVQGEPQVLTSLSRLLPDDALHLAGGVHLHLLAAPLAAQVPLKLLLDPTAAHPILDPVALGLELGVFLFHDPAGVTEHVGCQPAVGIAAQDVHIHLGALEPGSLLPEAQHLLRLEATGQSYPKSLRIGTTTSTRLQLGRR